MTTNSGGKVTKITPKSGGGLRYTSSLGPIKGVNKRRTKRQCEDGKGEERKLRKNRKFKGGDKKREREEKERKKRGKREEKRIATPRREKEEAPRAKPQTT